MSGDLAGDLERPGLEPRIRHDFVHEPDPKGFGSVDAVAGEGELHRVAESDEAGQPLAPAATGNDSDVQLRLSQGCAARGDSDVAGHREYESATETIAVDHRDDRLRHSVHGVVQRAVFVHAPLVHRRASLEFVDVRPRGEGLLTRPCDDDNASRLVRVKFAEGADEFFFQDHRHRVQLVRAVQGDKRNRILRADENRLESHGMRRGKATGRLESSLPRQP